MKIIYLKKHQLWNHKGWLLLQKSPIQKEMIIHSTLFYHQLPKAVGARRLSLSESFEKQSQRWGKERKKRKRNKATNPQLTRGEREAKNTQKNEKRTWEQTVRVPHTLRCIESKGKTQHKHRNKA